MNNLGKIITVTLVVIIAAFFTYFHISLNRMNNRLNEIQEGTFENAATISEIVNFFNANLNENAQNTNK